MGGILHFLDFNHASTSRKLLAHKRHSDGMEAPRNSMEFPSETAQSYHAIYENIPFSCQVKNPFKVNYSSGTPMKKLIDEEMSNKANSICNAPSVVARLMGMDTLPSEPKPSTASKEKSNEISRNNVPRNTYYNMGSVQHRAVNSMPVKQRKEESPSNNNEVDSSKSTQGSRTRPRPREHPQEEILQKFKKEFEAWQTNKVWEHTKVIDLDRNLHPGREKLAFAQGNLNKEKMTHFADAKRSLAHEKTSEAISYNSTSILNGRTRGTSLHHEGSISKHLHSSSVEATTFGNCNKFTDSGQFPIMISVEKNDRSSSPTRIVILKPSSENNDDIEEVWPGSVGNVRKEVSMEDFLEEVKERLRMEIQGKSRNGATSRGNATEALSKERLTDPKQIAQQIARQIRESVTRDMGTTLIRSESTRSYKSDIQLNESDSLEFINRDTRKLVSERLRNTLRNEEEVEVSTFTHGKARASVLLKEGVRLRPSPDFTKGGKKMNYWEEGKNLTEGKNRSFRQGEENGVAFSGELSPRNLVRSLSAPVSGTAFGKLLLEDQHVLTGAHIRRKHEAIESTSARKNRKDGFNFKGRVSNLRHNLTLKGKLFGKRVHLAEEATTNELDRAKVPVNVPSVVMNLGIAQENPTEVPPSPASVSSGSHDDLCKPGHPSPVSPLEVPFVEEQPSRQVSEEISCNLPEPTPSTPPETEGAEELTTESNCSEDEIVDVDSLEAAYVRDVLVIAGLYERDLSGKLFLRWETLSQPLAKWVFEEVEKAYGNKHEKTDEEGSLMESEDTSVDHKILFDLMNEALPYVLTPPMTSPRLKRLTSTAKIPHGKKLLDIVWHQIQILTHPLEEEPYSLEGMAANDVRKAPWPVMVHEHTDGIGVEVELMILEQLLDEFVCDLCSQ